MGPWIEATSSSADAETNLATPILRDRFRQLVRDNPHAETIVDVRVGAIVGSGHLPRPACTMRTPDGQTVPDKAANDAVLELWEKWQAECDAEGGLTFAGIQTLAARAWQEGGDCLIRRRRRRATDGLSVPLQLQLLEGDYLDASRDGIQTKGGGKVVQGIEFDSIGRRKAYWLFKSHPGDNVFWPGDSGVSVSVKADGIAHLYTAKRAGQNRGVPCAPSSMLKMRTLDKIEESAGVKLRMESNVAAFVTYENPEDAQLTGKTTGPKNKPTTRFGPGMIIPVPHGKDVRFSQPTGTSNADALMNRHLHAIAAGGGITYEQMTGDLSQVNFASIRVGLIEVRRRMRALQRQQFQPLFLDKVWEWFIDMALLVGALEHRDEGYPVKWQAPRFEEVDRQTDATADEIGMRSGGTSWGNVAASNGHDPEELFRDIAHWKQRFEDIGITLTWMAPQPGAATDPVQASMAGATPPNGSAPKPTAATA